MSVDRPQTEGTQELLIIKGFPIEYEEFGPMSNLRGPIENFFYGYTPGCWLLRLI